MLIRYSFWTYGALSSALGIIDIFLPVLPVTPLVLLAAACWAKAPSRFHHQLHRYLRFGPMVQNWEHNCAVPRRVKYFVFSMMTASCLFSFWRFPKKR